jgi:hypothetical protein
MQQLDQLRLDQHHRGTHQLHGPQSPQPARIYRHWSDRSSPRSSRCSPRAAWAAA